MISEYMDSVTLKNDFWIYRQCISKKWFLNTWAVWATQTPITEYMGSVTKEMISGYMGSVAPHNDYWIYGQCDHTQRLLNIWAVWPNQMIS